MGCKAYFEVAASFASHPKPSTCEVCRACVSEFIINNNHFHVLTATKRELHLVSAAKLFEDKGILGIIMSEEVELYTLLHLFFHDVREPHLHTAVLKIGILQVSCCH